MTDSKELKLMPFQTSMCVKATLEERLLGGSPPSEDMLRDFVAKNAPDAPSREEEIAALGPEEVEKKDITVFARDGERCHMWDYQWKGYFKSCCGFLGRVEGTESSKLKAYKKVIDGLIFIKQRKLYLTLPEGAEVGRLSRPLRCETAQGPRIAIATSETVPPGTTLEFTIIFPKPVEKKAKKADDPKKAKKPDDPKKAKKPETEKKAKSEYDIEACIREWLDYGCQHGTGQWRNAGFGRFTWKEVKVEDVAA